MTVDEAMRKATTALDEHIATALKNTVELLTNHGATEDELEAEMRHQAQELQEWRAVQLAHLRSWLEREGETLQ